MAGIGLFHFVAEIILHAGGKGFVVGIQPSRFHRRHIQLSLSASHTWDKGNKGVQE